MKVITSCLVSLVIGGLLLIAVPHQAAAACAKDNPETKVDESEIETSFAFGLTKCFPKHSKDGGATNPIMVALLDIFNFLAMGVGIVVTAGIIYGGILYSTANGNSSKGQQGITIITNSVIGLILFIFMYAIINFLVPGGLFG